MLPRARPFIDIDELRNVLSSRVDEEATGSFGKEFAKKIGAPAGYAIHRGRDALALALKIINIQPGDEVVVPNFVCTVVIDSILNVGAIPVVIDSSLREFNSTVEDYKKALTPKTRALLALHLYGIPAKMDQLQHLAAQNNCYLLEDCAHTLASKCEGRNVGTCGDLSFFSFNFDKPMSLGQGGMLVVNQLSLLEAADDVIGKSPRTSLQMEKKILQSLLLQHFLTADERYLRYLPTSFSEDILEIIPGLSKRIDAFIDSGAPGMLNTIAGQISSLQIIRKIAKKIPTLKSRKKEDFPMLMNSLRSKFGLEQMKHWEAVEEKRRANGQAYKIIFHKNSNFQLPAISNSFFAAFSRYTVLTSGSKRRDALILRAKREGVELDHGNWEKTIASNPGYRHKVKKNDPVLAASEELADRILHFPTHYYVSEDHLQRISTLVSEND